MAKSSKTPESQDQRSTGISVNIVGEKGFGFIDCNGVQYFFHRSAVRGGDFNRLQKSQEVTFIVRPSPKGPRAEDVAPA